MYIILAYDVNEERINRVHKVCKKYLFWVQNSLFEGELTEGRLKDMIRELETVIDPDEDAIVIYRLPSRKIFSKKHIGLVKNTGDTFLL